MRDPITIKLIASYGDTIDDEKFFREMTPREFWNFQQMSNYYDSQERKPTTKGWIYFLRGPGGLVKIGKSKNKPTKRVAEYSPKLPFETHLAFVFETSDIDYSEKYLHSVFVHRKVRGEWFRVTDNEIMDISLHAGIES